MRQHQQNLRVSMCLKFYEKFSGARSNSIARNISIRLNRDVEAKHELAFVHTTENLRCKNVYMIVYALV